MKTAIERLAESVGYPEKVPEGCLSFTFRVDETDVYAEEAGGRVVLSCTLTDDDSLLPALARYAAGRMLKEDAVLSFGQPGVSRPYNLQPAAFLWQDAPADAAASALRRLFETFADSCDWWRSRLEPRSEDDGPPPLAEVMIRP